MTVPGTFAAVGLAVVCSLALGAGDGAPATTKPGLPGVEAVPDGSRLIRPSILSERTALVPGEENWIAVRLLIAPEWHTYWRNAGESGVPPTFTFTTPDWVTVGDPVWPAPTRYSLPSGGVDYIYEHSATILFPVRVESDEREIRNDVEITVQVDWLVCKDVCLPGSKTVSRTISLWRDASPGEEAPAFEGARSLIPVKPTSTRSPKVSFEKDTLTIEAPGAAEIEFFPFESASIAFPVDAMAQGYSESGILKFTYDRPVTDTEAIAGAVRIRDAAGGDRYYEISVPVSPTPDQP